MSRATTKRAPRWFDVAVCCACLRELDEGAPKVSRGTGWLCAGCAYALDRERPEDIASTEVGQRP